MIGDKLLIKDYHRKAAAAIYEALEKKLKQAAHPLAVSVSGESGCGKSETARVLADLCNQAGYKAIILQQDDYFVYPPKTNHQKRLEDINRVGLREVKLDLIEKNIEEIKTGGQKTITKPLVNYNLDSIGEETIPTGGIRVIVVEGTYTTTLKNADFRAFIDRNYRQTKNSRLDRSREPQSKYLEKVLSIEHEIIAAHKKLADLVIPAPQDEMNTRQPE